jgi:hypothetical protein
MGAPEQSIGFAGRLIFEDVGGLGVEALGGGVDPFEIARLYGGAGSLSQELPENVLDESGAGLFRTGDAVNGSQDISG